MHTIESYIRTLIQLSAISRYFDHCPSLRRSFLEAVQRVAGHGSLLTPVATPAESTLDDEPAVSDSKEDANQTDSITHDDMDERVHDKGQPYHK
jgi:hypothetical protein